MAYRDAMCTTNTVLCIPCPYSKDWTRIFMAICALLLAFSLNEGPTREHPKIYGTSDPASLMGGFNGSIIGGAFNTAPTIDQSLPFDDSYKRSSQDAKEENSNAGPPLSICFVSHATADH